MSQGSSNDFDWKAYRADRDQAVHRRFTTFKIGGVMAILALVMVMGGPPELTAEGVKGSPNAIGGLGIGAAFVGAILWWFAMSVAETFVKDKDPPPPPTVRTY